MTTKNIICHNTIQFDDKIMFFKMIHFAELNKLYTAIENDNLHEVEALLTLKDVRDNIAANNNQAFRLVASNGHIDIVRLLLKYSAVRDK